MPWPADNEHHYELWLEKANSSGLHRAYVIVHPRDSRGRIPSRFAVRLDLPGTYLSKISAEATAFRVANQFSRGKLALPKREVSTTVKGYVITARARFRADCHEWEPALRIKSTRSVNKGASQAFDGNDSPFFEATFPTAEAAARFALSYGERMAMGMVGGLRV